MTSHLSRRHVILYLEKGIINPLQKVSDSIPKLSSGAVRIVSKKAVITKQCQCSCHKRTGYGTV